MEKQLYALQREMLNQSQIIITNCRCQDEEGAIAAMKQLIAQLSGWLDLAEQYRKKQSQGALQFPKQEEIMQTLQQILAANETGDFVLQADYLELLLIPLLLQCQQALRMDGENWWQPEEQVWQKNQEYVKEMGIPLAQTKPYALEETNYGYATIALEDGRGSYYLHSNVNPMQEAGMIARQYYDPTVDEYIVIGAGIGYHIRALLALGEYIKVTVYESDLRILKTMVTYLDISEYLKTQRLRLVYDPDYVKLSDDLDRLQENQKLVVHAPSIRNIANSQIQNAIQNYYRSESSLRHVEQLLQANFYQNQKHCVGNADALRPCFADKKVIIVSAGPSLLKNVEQLLTIDHANTIILAVTTVYRKLLEYGIIPDFVIHLDPQAKTWSHLRNITEKVPLILLSTGYEGCSRKYSGKTYIAYQKEFDLAEEAAEKEGHILYETGGSVATLALDVALKNGAYKVILIGQDLAFTDNLAHAKGVSGQYVGDLKNAVTTPGYYGGQVKTSRVFLQMLKWFEQYMKQHPEYTQKVINATEGGAEIPGMTQMPLKEALQKI